MAIGSELIAAKAKPARDQQEGGNREALPVASREGECAMLMRSWFEVGVSQIGQRENPVRAGDRNTGASTKRIKYHSDGPCQRFCEDGLFDTQMMKSE